MRTFSLADTEPGRYVETTYYDGILHGWITYYTDTETGLAWWLDRNQWRIYHNGGWLFTGDVAYQYRANSWAGLVLGLIAFLVGAAAGYPGIVIGFVFGLFCVLLGLGNDRLANRHPHAYQAASVASAAMLANTVYRVGRRL